MSKNKRSCFDCRHFSLCFLFHRVEQAVSGVRILNLDGNDAPGTLVDIYKALGSACLEFKPREASSER
jgi:hypothetical protein